MVESTRSVLRGDAYFLQKRMLAELSHLYYPGYYLCHRLQIARSYGSVTYLKLQTLTMISDLGRNCCCNSHHSKSKVRQSLVAVSLQLSVFTSLKAFSSIVSLRERELVQSFWGTSRHLSEPYAN